MFNFPKDTTSALIESTVMVSNLQDERAELRQKLAVAKANEMATHEANKRMARQLTEYEDEIRRLRHYIVTNISREPV